VTSIDARPSLSSRRECKGGPLGLRPDGQLFAPFLSLQETVTETKQQRAAC
jgi:hypothetical protein